MPPDNLTQITVLYRLGLRLAENNEHGYTREELFRKLEAHAQMILSYCQDELDPRAHPFVECGHGEEIE